MTGLNPEKQPLLALVNRETPLDPAGYDKKGGWRGLRRALGMSPAEIITEVTDSKLRGRGGAGFSTGMKWSFVPKESSKDRLKYIVANGDEMEPGTFKDRILVEGNPLQLIEGMIISAYAIQARHGIIFLRGEYHLGLERLQQAVIQRVRPDSWARTFLVLALILICMSIPPPVVISAVKKRL